MVYGPWRKMGIFRDTSLQPLHTKVENFEIIAPVKEIEKDGKRIREVETSEIRIDVELWYLPAGTKGEVGKDQFLFYKTTKTVVLK